MTRRILAILCLALQLIWCAHGQVQEKGFHQIEESRFEQTGFSWEDCGNKGPIEVQILEVIPGVIPVPGKVQLSTKILLKEELNGFITAHVELRKKIGPTFVKIPCVENVGSCTYEDVCALMPGHKETNCPEEWPKGIPCKCPFKANTYSVEDFQIAIPDIGESPVQLSGQYKVTVNLYTKEKDLGCLTTKFSIE